MIGKLNNNNFNQQNFTSTSKTEPPIYSNSFHHNIPQKKDNLLDLANQQEMTPEILNISKIKDGFFIGDKISAISIDVINEFKISHIINCTGEQILNQWESIGINYLTINWSENPNQILFDIKDELSDKILEFIDTALYIGEGVLAHSLNGKNRVCIIVIIYLMKKYKWSLYKSMEYLKTKKNDVDIPNYFYNQLENFQKRLIQRGELRRDIPWEFENLIDEEEKLLRNTFLNTLPPNKNVGENEKNNNRIMDLLIGNYENNNNIDNSDMNSKHIIWADNNPYSIQKGKIEIYNLNNDLCLKKDIKPILFHLKSRPIKPCIKNNRNKSSEIQFKINVNTNNNINNFNQRINFNNSDKNLYQNEYINKIENNKIFMNNIDKNISDNNTNSNTPAEDIKDLIENKFIFNIGSINSLKPKNVKKFDIFEENYIKENATDYSPIYNKDNKISVINKINNKDIPNNKISNYVIGYNKKDKNNANNNNTVLNTPINNVNPNLLGIKNKSLNGKGAYKNSHPLFNKNKQNTPVKIKTYNNSNCSSIKKPGTPILNHYYNSSSHFASKEKNNNSQNVSIKKSSSFSNNFTSSSSPISYNSNINIKNNKYNHRNKSSSERPSTAPHKEKNKNISGNGINFNSNINPKNKKNIKTSIKPKNYQRPLSAENKNKLKNNNFSKNYLSNNNQNNSKINNYYNNIYGTGNNTYNNKDVVKNNSKPNENQKFNLAKQRRPSPVIKSNNFLNKKINK